MRVDVGKRSLHFAVNDGNFKEVAKIKMSKSPYYFAVSNRNDGDQVSLTNYSCTTAQKEEVKETEDRVNTETDPAHDQKPQTDNTVCSVYI